MFEADMNDSGKVQKVAHFNRSPRLPADLRKSGARAGNGAGLYRINIKLQARQPQVPAAGPYAVSIEHYLIHGNHSVRTDAFRHLAVPKAIHLFDWLKARGLTAQTRREK